MLDKEFYKNFATKLDSIVNDRYGKRADFATEYSDRYNAPGIDETFKNWFAGRSIPKAKTLYNLCELLDCDIEYLLGSQKEYRREYRNASDYTGLSSESIEHIAKLSKAEKQALDIMFEYYDMNRFLHSLSTAATFLFANGEIRISMKSSIYESDTLDKTSEMAHQQSLLEERLNNHNSRQMLMFQINQDSLSMIERVLQNDSFRKEATREVRNLIQKRYEQSRPEAIKERHKAFKDMPMPEPPDLD